MASSRIVCHDFRDYRRDRFIDAQTSARAKLAPTQMLTLSMGANSDIPDLLGPNDWARVEFDIASDQVKSAELVFYVKGAGGAGDEPHHLLVNGHRINHHQKPETFLTGGWDRARIAARYLKKGVNEIVFCNGRLYVDPGTGDHSSRSFDGGKTWHRGTLGADGQTKGEYIVRLRLKGFALRGELLSPVFDLADPESGGIAPRVNIHRVRLAHEKEAPRGTRVDFEMRSGSTPAFAPRQWSSWEQGATLQQPGRFAQWRAVLSSSSAATTPVLKSVTLAIDHATDRGSLKGIELLESDQPEIVYSSYDFDYLTPHYKVDRLVKENRLDEVIAPGGTELEKLALLRNWVHSQWLGWQSGAYPFCPSWDAVEILETTKGNWGFGMCTHYGAVFTACASALGWVARVLIVDHHCLAEVWSDDLQRWILEDAGPSSEYDCQYETSGSPIGALEVHRLHQAGKSHRVTLNQLAQYRSVKKVKMTKSWGSLFRRFGIPLRNNHLYQPEPAELHHGYSQYHWDGYLWWSVDIDPKFTEYSQQTARPADFNWSVNQTRLYPRVGAEAGMLEIDVETATPNFSHYEIRVDGSEWAQAEAPLSWALSTGVNEVEVRGVNAFGRAGRSARLQVGYSS